MRTRHHWTGYDKFYCIFFPGLISKEFLQLDFVCVCMYYFTCVSPLCQNVKSDWDTRRDRCSPERNSQYDYYRGHMTIADIKADDCHFPTEEDLEKLQSPSGTRIWRKRGNVSLLLLFSKIVMRCNAYWNLQKRTKMGWRMFFQTPLWWRTQVFPQVL